MPQAICAPLIALALLLVTPATAQEEPTPRASPSVGVHRTALAPAIGVFPQKDWPRKPLLPPIDIARFEAAVNRAFDEPQAAETSETRALVVVQNGALVYERYAEGFDENTKFISWSMAKSFTHALIGIAARKGLVDLERPLEVPEWSEPDDPRRAIRFSHLLSNTSGLRWRSVGEAAILQSDEARVLFGPPRRDVAKFVRTRTLDAPPGAVFEYNSGNFDLAAAQIARRLTPASAPEQKRSALHAFMTQELFAPLGITSAVAEYDEAGTFLGGSSLYMTASDYARFGLLYLREGNWKGEPVLPKGWAQNAATPVRAAGAVSYGAGFWLNRSTSMMAMPGVPETAYNASGNDGQVILIVPSHELVIVRLGKTPFENLPALGAFLEELILAFPERAS